MCLKKSMRAVPGEAGERDFCLCVSSAGCYKKEQGACVAQGRMLTLSSLA